MNKSLDKKVFVGFTRSRLSAPGFTRPWDVCDSSFRFFFRPQWHISLPLHIPEILEVVKLLPFQVHIPEAWKSSFGRSLSVLAITGTIPRGTAGKGYQPPLSHSMKCVQISLSFSPQCWFWRRYQWNQHQIDGRGAIHVLVRMRGVFGLLSNYDRDWSLPCPYH